MSPSESTSLRKRLSLANGPPSTALVEAFDGILGYAEHQALLSSVAAEKAIHEFRKSVRRARAIVKLVRDAMPNATYRALNGALRDAVAATSTLRDLDVLQDHVASLPDRPKLRTIKAALHRHFLASQPARHTHHASDVLCDGLRLLKPLPAQLQQGLSAKLQTKDLQAALASSFRRTRKALRAAESERPGVYGALHTFRKRTKELRYQLELLRPRLITDEPLAALRRLASDLGEIMDLVVLRDYVRSHVSELEVICKPLLQRLDDRAGAHRDKVLRGAATCFQVKPKVFAALQHKPNTAASSSERDSSQA